MGLGISDRTLSECINMFINSIDIEKINLKYLLVDAGLSKEAVKEILNVLVDRFSDNPIKPAIKIDTEKEVENNFKEALVHEYNLTYTIANNLINTYRIVRPEQLSYLSDQELLNVTGIGKSTLVKIRDKFPYVRTPDTSSVINISITELYLPTKVEETLRDNGILYVQHLDYLVDEEIQSIGYPMCTIIDEGYKLYKLGCKDKSKYVMKYLEILKSSYDRNLNNIIRHSSEKLNLYWIDKTVYLIITYLYEIITSDKQYSYIRDIWEELCNPRDEVLTKYSCNMLPDDNGLILQRYAELQDIFKDIVVGISQA